MTQLLQLIKRYSIQNDKKIKKICAPLFEYLNVPVFTYYFVEADGRFGYITNASEFNEYYFQHRLFLENPYFSHPSLFRSGYTLAPCSIDEKTQENLTHKFNADHLFLKIQANESKMEGFIFAQENVKSTEAQNYLSHLDLFEKFGAYFKKEASEIIGKMKSEQFNLLPELGTNRFETPSAVPLCKQDPNIQAFLKSITVLSKQEIRCVELFKNGNSAQATAAIMGLSQRTVENYFENIKYKLNISSKFELLDF